MMLSLSGATASGDGDRAHASLTDTNRATMTMDSGIKAKLNGDFDRDFITMITPHHQA